MNIRPILENFTRALTQGLFSVELMLLAEIQLSISKTKNDFT